MKKVASEIVRVRKVLKLMKEKKEPVVSRRKLDKKPTKLDIEKFLPKERSKTVSDEIINSRRIKQALDVEYARVQGKANDKVKEALKKLVTKSSGDIIEEQRALDIIKENKANAEKSSSTRQLLEYFEGKETPEQLLNRVPEYVDAEPAVKKEIRDLIKLGGYRDLAKQKSIVKKFIGGTPAQRMLLVAEVEATPTAQAMKREMADIKAVIRAEKELMIAEKKEKLANDKLLAAQKISDAKADKAAKQLLAAQKISDAKNAKADKAAKKLLAKSNLGITLSPAEQQVLLDKQTRDAETARLALEAQVAQVEADRLAQEALDKLAAKKTKEAELSALLATGKSNKEAKEALAKQKIEDARIAEEARQLALRKFNAGKKVNIDAEALRLKERSEALAKFKSGKKANIEAESLKLPKEIAKEEARVKEEDRLKAVAKEEKKRAEKDAAEKKIADDLEESIKHVMKKMEKKGYKPGRSDTTTNNPSIRAEAARRFELAKNEAAAKLAALAPAPVPVAGKGFKKLNKDTGRGFTTAQLPYGARMMIERYDNEKRLRKNV
jgi:hypothetical protein